MVRLTIIVSISASMLAASGEEYPGLNIPAGVVYLGCFPTNSSSPALVHKIDGWAGMSIDSCSDSCMKIGSILSGTWNGTDCFCDSHAHTDTVQNNMCDVPCEGNASQICGGSKYLSVVVQPEAADTQEAVNSGDYNIMGCYRTSQLRSGQADVAQEGMDTERMDHDVCKERCWDLDYNTAGLTDGTQCFCGSMGPESDFPTRLDDVDCSAWCTGNAAIRCGGNDSMILLHAGPVAQDVLGNSTSAASALNARHGGWTAAIGALLSLTLGFTYGL